MQTTDRKNDERPRWWSVSHLLKRRFYAALIVVYLMATVSPAAGQYLATLKLGINGAVDLALTHILLAGILAFSSFAAPQSHAAAARDYLRVLMTGVGIRYGLGLLAVVAATFMNHVTGGQTELAAAATVVAFLMLMPSAFSAIGWTFQAGGNVWLALHLVIITTIISPLLVAFVQPILSVHSASWNTASIWPFLQLFVVIGCSLMIGLAARRRRTRRCQAIDTWCQTANSVLILALNYCQASRVLPQLVDLSWTSWLPLVATAPLICALGYAVSRKLAQVQRIENRDAIALFYGSGMYNTGVALVVVPMLLPSIRLALLAPLLLTLTQHLLASLWSPETVERSATLERGDQSDSSTSSFREPNHS